MISATGHRVAAAGRTSRHRSRRAPLSPRVLFFPILVAIADGYAFPSRPSSTIARPPLRTLPTTRAFGASAARKTSGLAASASAAPPDDEGFDSFLGSIYGGDHAGLSATYSPATGSLVPIPVHLVPESLLEWDAAPDALEVLTSEDVGDGSLSRKTLTVLPEVGCGVDNLDVLSTSETVELTAAFSSRNDAEGRGRVGGFEVRPHDDNRIRIETVFRIAPEDDEDLGTSLPRRVRVSLVADAEARSLSTATPVTVILERRTSDASSGGAVADGGGLDGRTVGRLIGKRSEKEFDTGGDGADVSALDGDWKRIDGGDVPKVAEGGWSTTISLPGNVFVRTGTAKERGEWIVEVSHLETMSTDAPGRNVARRTVVQRSYLPDRERAGDVKFWTEERAVGGE